MSYIFYNIKENTKKQKKGEKAMKKNEKRMIGILVVITLIVVIVAIVMNNKNKNKEVEENTVPEEEFVNVLEDGTRFNTSDKLHETKTFDGMEITNFQLTEKDNVTLLLGTVTNTSSTTKGGYPVNVTVVDKQGNEIITVAAFLGPLEPGQSTQFSTSATFDYANAYDFSITKK